MKPTWHRADWTLVDCNSREGTVSVFLMYNIGCWTFGARFEHDPCWFSLHIEVGPVEVSICYWRRHGAVIDT